VIDGDKSSSSNGQTNEGFLIKSVIEKLSQLIGGASGEKIVGRDFSKSIIALRQLSLS
jgi:hypothetical protein